jgi:hypothetical protein
MQIKLIITIFLFTMTARCQVINMPVGGKDHPEAIDILYNPAFAQGFDRPAIAISTVIPYGMTQVQDNQVFVLWPFSGNVISAGIHRIHLEEFTASDVTFGLSRGLLPGLDIGLFTVYSHAKEGSDYSSKHITGGAGFVSKLSAKVYASGSLRYDQPDAGLKKVMFHSSLAIYLSQQVNIGAWMENISEQQAAVSIGLNYRLASNLHVRCMTQPLRYNWNVSALILFNKVFAVLGIRKNDVPGLTTYSYFHFQPGNNSNP